MFGPQAHGLDWMRGLNRAIPVVSLAALAGVSCSFPTDNSDKVFVTLDAPARVVLRGHDMSVYAQAWHVVGIDTQRIANDMPRLRVDRHVVTAQHHAGGSVERHEY